MTAVDEGAPRREIGEDVYCPSCGYNLHRAPGDRCPECGYPLERLRSSISPIPWEHRRQRGRFRTFWQTVWLVSFRLRRFSEAYAGRVAYTDARLLILVAIAPHAVYRHILDWYSEHSRLPGSPPIGYDCPTAPHGEQSGVNGT